MKKLITLFAAALLVVAIAATSACSKPASGAGETTTITGMVTKTDLNAKTFSVKAKNGKDYDFKMVANSKGDIKEIKEHQDLKKEIEVRFRGSSNPFEVVFAD
jgi:hypothetical protein